jgi:hypothetical protein
MGSAGICTRTATYSVQTCIDRNPWCNDAIRLEPHIIHWRYSFSLFRDCGCYGSDHFYHLHVSWKIQILRKCIISLAIRSAPEISRMYSQPYFIKISQSVWKLRHFLSNFLASDWLILVLEPNFWPMIGWFMCRYQIHGRFIYTST